MRFATITTVFPFLVIAYAGVQQCCAFSARTVQTRDHAARRIHCPRSTSCTTADGEQKRHCWCHRPKQRLTPHRRDTIMLQSSSDDSDKASTKASIQFSGIDLDKDFTTTNPIDYVLSLVTSDVGSIVLGLAGLVILLVGRLVLDDPDVVVESMGQQTRSNLLAVFSCGAVLLNGISKLDVTSALAQVVVLEGIELDEPKLISTNADSSTSAVQWVLESVLAATPAKTGVLLRTEDGLSWNVLAAAGTIPGADSSGVGTVPSYTPILDRFKSGTNKESYLPTLQALPGKAEFTYLPENTQAALLLPVGLNDSSGKTTVLALGSNQARSFSPRNVAWGQAVAARLADDMMV